MKRFNTRVRAHIPAPGHWWRRSAEDVFVLSAEFSDYSGPLGVFTTLSDAQDAALWSSQNSELNWLDGDNNTWSASVQDGSLYTIHITRFWRGPNSLDD